FSTLLDLEGCSGDCIVDRGGIVRGNTTHAKMSREGRDHAEMIRSYWELHFDEQYNEKKGYGFKE
ncbi:hypothetical protein B296_00004558, partial [Ensete ventricosum]